MKGFEAKRFGDYFLLDQIGQGGMAEVFLGATLPKEEKSLFVAIKRLFPKFSAQKSFVKRLISEAKISAILDHPNIVSVFNVGVFGESFYLSMEWVDGKSLDQVLEKSKQTGTPLPKSAIFYILHEVAKALDYAHTAKDPAGRDLELIHQDLTPGNILVSYGGDVKITDFGIATAERQAQQKDSRQPAFGKIPYMAPEQIRKEGVTRRSDLFSLGVVAYELLSGSKPFQTKNALEMVELPAKQPPDFQAPAFSEDEKLQDFLRSHLKPNPEERPLSANAWTEFLMPSEVNVGRSLLVAWMAEAFSKEQKIEKERRNLGVHQLAIEKSRPEERAPVVDEEQIVEQTQFLSRHEPVQETRVAFKEPSISKGIARVDLKKAVSHRKVKPPKPVEEAPLNPELSNPRIHRVPPPPEDSISGTHESDEKDHDTAPEWKKKGKEKIDRERRGDTSDVAATPDTSTNEDEMVLTTNENLSEEVHSLSEPETDAPKLDRAKAPADRLESEGSDNRQASQDVSAKESPPKKRVSRGRTIQPKRVAPSRFQAPQLPKLSPTILAIVVSISLGVLFFVVLMNLRGDLHVNVPLVPMRSIEVYFVFEGVKDTSTLKEDLSWGNPGTRKNIWQTPLQRFFNREYKRYGGELPFPFALKFQPIRSGLPPMNSQGTFFHPYRPFEYLTAAFKLPLELKEPYTGRVFILAYPKEPTEAPRYPIHFSGKRTAGQGIFFLPLDSYEIERAKIRLAHEIAHVAGAQDKFDDDLQPEYPQGYVEPKKSPLHPQNFAEIMAPMIPQSPNEIKPPKTLDQIRIGEATAIELGWIQPRD